MSMLLILSGNGLTIFIILAQVSVAHTVKFSFTAEYFKAWSLFCACLLMQMDYVNRCVAGHALM